MGRLGTRKQAGRGRSAGRIASLSLRAVFPLLAITVALTNVPSLPAAEFQETFDGGQPSWKVRLAEGAGVRLVKQLRTTEFGPDGSGVEGVRFAGLTDAGQAGPSAWLEHELPPARVFDELTLSLQVKANIPGAQPLLRVVFPDVKNPATGGPLAAYVRGDSYTDTGKWQRLTCATTGKQLQEQIRLFRSQFSDLTIDGANAYVDRAYLEVRTANGNTDVLTDDLRFGPIVKPPQEAVVRLASAEGETSEPFPVRYELDRLLLNGKPFFPRLTTYHGEPLDILQLTGVNVVWIPDFEDTELLAGLREHGLWATATPPRATTETGSVIDTRNVSMLPFTEATRSILFWMLGTRVPAEARDDLIGFIEQVRSADAKFRRPLMVDLTGGEERAVSRHVPMLGVSRHTVNTSFSLKQYRDWLIQKKNFAQQGSLLWTWIQTEPATATIEARRAAGRAPVVMEPEQIRLQTYAALAAGCRGLGFWKSVPLDSDAPGALERRLMMAQLSLELDLLAPWLTTGSVENQLPFSVEVTPRQGSTRLGIDFQNQSLDRGEIAQILQERRNEVARSLRRPEELEAAIVRSEKGTLLLPVWYDTDAQYVPGQMTGNNARIRIEGVPDTSKAWEINTTGVRSLKSERVPGGMLVTLEKFDQTAAVVVSSDPSLYNELVQMVQQTAEPSAKLHVQLAKAKLERVAAVDAELQSIGQGQPDALRILTAARFATEQAQTSLERGDWDGARVQSASAMETLRILQKAHWNLAVSRMSSPISSPHTACFQTLPDHWRLVAQLGRSPMHGIPNLLRSGDFEDRDAMLVEGWQHAQNDLPGIQAAAEMYPVAQQGEYALRLVAVPKTGQDPPLTVPRSPVVVTTPAVTVHSGQVVHISGWVRVSTPVSGSLDGVMLYDSLTGPTGALRWHRPCEWQKFTLIREVPQSGELSLTMALCGMGEVQFDDLQILPHNPRNTDPLAAQPAADPSRNALNFFERIPGVRQLSNRTNAANPQ